MTNKEVSDLYNGLLSGPFSKIKKNKVDNGGKIYDPDKMFSLTFTMSYIEL